MIMEFQERSKFNAGIRPTTFSKTAGLLSFQKLLTNIKMEINEKFVIKYKHLKIYFLFLKFFILY